MGIKSFFSQFLSSGTNTPNGQNPTSNDDEMQNDSSLGKNITDEEQPVLSTEKEESSQEKESSQEEAMENLEKTDDNEAKKDSDVLDGKESEDKSSSPTLSTYNLIILDESGSMVTVHRETISGCNETLNSIRNMAKNHPEIKQYVSIFCFDTANSRYIFHDVPVEETRDLTMDDYCPNACTPLYDAIGYTVTQLRKLLVNSESVGVVTIITDGYENASRRWNQHLVADLIESLKRKGWVFTFIGANIDVVGTATGLGIDSYMEFQQTTDGMAEMFRAKRRSDMGYQAKRRYMQGMRSFGSKSLEERTMAYGNMNLNYFISEERIAPDIIHQLKRDEIFVFGSNIHGQHNGGASLLALEHFGAINGQAEGIQGRSYAIPTDGNSFEELKAAVERFNEYVVMHPQYRFMLTAIGCGTGGYSAEQIAPLFRQAYSFGNVYIPRQFLPYMPEDPNL